MNQVDPTIAIEIDELPGARNIEVRNASSLTGGLENASAAAKVVNEASGRQIAEILHTVGVDVADLGVAITEPERLLDVHNSNGLRHCPVFAVEIVSDGKPGCGRDNDVRTAVAVHVCKAHIWIFEREVGHGGDGNRVAKVLSIDRWQVPKSVSATLDNQVNGSVAVHVGKLNASR